MKSSKKLTRRRSLKVLTEPDAIQLGSNDLLSKISSIHIYPNESRILNYPPNPKDSKELITILGPRRSLLHVLPSSIRETSSTQCQAATTSNKLSARKTKPNKYEQRKERVLDIINFGHMRELVELRGIGPKTAQAIMAHSKANGPISTIPQLKKIRYLPYKRFLELNMLKDK